MRTNLKFFILLIVLSGTACSSKKSGCYDFGNVMRQEKSHFKPVSYQIYQVDEQLLSTDSTHSCILITQ